MKTPKALKVLTFVLAISALTVIPAFATTGGVLKNSGIGQRAGDTTQFGVGVCNKGTAKLTSSVTVVVNANSVTQYPTINSLAVGQCGFAYEPYATFNMASGQTYSVRVTIDPQHSFAENADTQATYSVTVPGGEVLGANTVNRSAAYQYLADQFAYLASIAHFIQSILSHLHL